MILDADSQGSMLSIHCHWSARGNYPQLLAKKYCRLLLRRTGTGTIRSDGKRAFQELPVDRTSFSFVTGEEIMTTASNTWQLGRLHHLGVTVADIDRSIEFYRDILGMELVGRRPCVDADYVAKQTGYPGVQLSVASFRVCADSPQTLEVVQYLNCPGEPVDQATNRPGNTHLCILVDDLQGAFDDLSQQGVQFKSDPVTITAGPNEGGLVVYFYDPDGYPMEMFQPPAQG